MWCNSFPLFSLFLVDPSLFLLVPLHGEKRADEDRLIRIDPSALLFFCSSMAKRNSFEFGARFLLLLLLLLVQKRRERERGAPEEFQRRAAYTSPI
jgi:hypothetical protein